VKGQAVEVFRPRLMVIERRGGVHRVAEGGMGGDVGDTLAVDVNGAPVT
jgi:hypothetical protein